MNDRGSVMQCFRYACIIMLQYLGDINSRSFELNRHFVQNFRHAWFHVNTSELSISPKSSALVTFLIG